MQYENGTIKSPKPIKKKFCILCGQLNLQQIGRKCNLCQVKQSRERAKQQKILKSQRLVVKKLKKKLKRENNTKRLKKELDRVFSIWIRKRDSDKNGKVICPCCCKMLDWQEAQNMHYITRSCMALRYEPKNCKAGCLRCNVMLHGNYPAYTEYILREHGIEYLNWLLKMKNEIKQWTPDELKEMIAFYKEKLSTL